MIYVHRTNSSVYFTFFVLFVVSRSVECREWQSIVDHDIIRKSNIDSSRYELKIESDPFFYPEDKSPTDIPTESPHADIARVWTTVGPTESPSFLPSDGPSLGPTEWDIERNGGCRNGLSLYQVHMYDTWGDGWEKTKLTISGISDSKAADLPTNSMTTTNTKRQGGGAVVSISKTIELGTSDSTAAHPNPQNEIDPLGLIFEGDLRRGSHDYADVCFLPNRCYQVIVSGGEFVDEVSWDIRASNNDPSSPPLEPILAGGAPSACTFSLPDEYGHHFCPNTCSETIPADAMIVSPEVMNNLSLNNDGIAAESLTEAAIGHSYMIESGSLDGKTQTSVPLTESMQSRMGGVSNTASSILNNFKSVESDEHSNN